MSRFIIEGTWSGYSSHQMRVVHRTVHPASSKKLRAWADKTHAISYTDGTKLILRVRDCTPRERVEQIKGYASLIDNCAHHDVSSVQALIDIEQEQKNRRAA